MTSRRDFLKTGTAAAVGIVFCSCGLLQSAHAQQSVRQKLPVMVAGKRVKTIDVHAHCAFTEAVALLDGPAALPPPVRGADEAVIEIERRFAAMDAQAVDMEGLSINPIWYDRDRDLAGKIVKIQNEKLAELCAAHSDRFAGFASLTLQAPDLAVQELETAVRKQGLKGAAIGGSVYGVAELNKRVAGNGWLANTVAFPMETSLALSHMIFEGTFDRFPKLKVIAAHGGGFLPSYADRSDHACLVSPANCDPNIKLQKKPTEYLRQIYFDS